MSEEAYRILERWLGAREFVIVGKSVERMDALEKVTGRAKYVEDYFFDGMAFSRLVKSTHPHAVLRGIDVSEARRVPGFLSLVTAEDVPGVNQVGYAIPDQPLLAQRKVRFYGEPVALAVAETPEAAEESRDLVRVEYGVLPAVFDPIEALTSRVLVHEERGSNVALETRVHKGDVGEGFSRSDVIVENTYRTGYQDHAYLETEAAIALPEPDGVTVIASIQYPHLVQTVVSRVLGMRLGQVRVVQACVGGAFGGKDDMGPIVSAQAAVAAHKLRRPVMLTYTREDSFDSRCKRDPAIIRYRSGASWQGKLMAIEVDITFDCGAYANRGPFTLWRATMHASGPYEVPNARISGHLVYTNKVYQGSFRGFGNPQIQFAAESQMDELAEELEIDPIEFRLRNMLREGSSTITSQVLDHSVGIYEALAQVEERSQWKSKRHALRELGEGRLRGIGVGCGWHGISTSRGVPDWANAVVNVNRDGSVSCYVGICEMGQGTTTSHAQILSEVLGVPINYVTVNFGTSTAPDTGATHGSRGTSIGGIGVLLAAGKLRERIERVAAELLCCDAKDVVAKDGEIYDAGDPSKRLTWEELVKKCYERGAEMSATGYFFLPKGKFDEERGQGFAYVAFSYIATVAEVEVDTNTGSVKVLRVWPALASGRIVNPSLVLGQIEGAVLQGIGYTLLENLVVSEGRILNNNFTDYIVPLVSEMPSVEEPVFVEDLYRYGPFGAKGVGEMALIPIPAAITSAIRHATGVAVRELPVTAEKLYFLLRGGA